MGRPRRQITYGKVYEICFRAREGLPLPPNCLINELITSILARAQRDNKVTICHQNWLSNHPHMIIRALDGEQATRFYGEVKKRITDFIKALLGLDHLTLWEDRCTCSEILDVAKVMDRIAYLYANPAEADLEETIEKFPGVSSWNVFNKSIADLNFNEATTHPWIRLPHVEKLPSSKLTESQVRFFRNKFKSKASIFHSLVIKPNEWMKAFGIDDPKEIKEINLSIIADLRGREKVCAERRARENKKVMKAHRLVAEQIMKSHTPKKKSRRIFVLSSNPAVRVEFIQSFKSVCDKLRNIYEEWKVGDFSTPWPPGWFKPPVPILANAVR